MNATGVKELWIAVVQQAIKDYHKDPMVSKSHLTQMWIRSINQSASHWLFDSKLSGPGSLDWICENIDLSKTYIRKVAKNPIQEG